MDFISSKLDNINLLSKREKFTYTFYDYGIATLMSHIDCIITHDKVSSL